MNIRIVLGILITVIVIVTAGYWYTRGNQNFTMYQNDEIGFRVQVPKDWVVSTSTPTSAAEGRYVVLRSPDYKKGENIYEANNFPAKGSGFFIPLDVGLELTQDIATPELFVTSEIESLKNGYSCPNCNVRRVTLGGQAALVSTISDKLVPGRTTTQIVTARDGRIFGINYVYELLSSENQKILDKFLASFVFTK